MTEQEYIDELEERTGLKLGKDFGFIMGRRSPFDIPVGFFPVNKEDGYIIWRKGKRQDGSVFTVEKKTPGMSFEQTVEFLQSPIPNRELVPRVGIASIGEYETGLEQRFIPIKDAMSLIIKELANDPVYYYGWQANIAMAFKDAWEREYQRLNGEFLDGPEDIQPDVHTVANEAAKNFLNLLIKK